MLAVHEDQVAGNIKTGLSEIGTYVRQLPGSEAQSGAVKAVRDEVGTLKGNLAQTRIAMLDLRSSIEDGVQARRRDLAEVNKRIERVEGILAARDLTGSVPPAPLKRRTYRIVSGWSVTNVQNGGAIVTGERGIFEVRPGSIIPGLGQVASVRQRASGWIVVTDKGIIVQH